MAKTQNIILACADYRCEEALRHIVDRLGTTDRLVELGASVGLIEEKSRRAIIAKIDALIGLHGCRTLTIVDHMDCGKYRMEYGKRTSEGIEYTPDQEREQHLRNLEDARKWVSTHFPQVAVKTILLEHDADSDQMSLQLAEPTLAHA